MRSFRIIHGIMVFVLLLSMCLTEVAADVVPASRLVRKIRHYSGPDKTRIVLDLSGSCKYSISERTRPHRIVIDIPSVRFSSSVRMIRVSDGILTRIRINKLRKGAQIVFDLPRKIKYKHYTLGPNYLHPDRIVIDLERTITTHEKKERVARAEKVASSGDLIVIVDPGHGGGDPGTSSRSGIKEKTIVLSISRMIKEEIDSYKGFKAILTRNGDYDVGLGDRIMIGRSHGGNCFVSIHANGNPSSKPRGSEIYYLSVDGADDENAESVAERENMIFDMGQEGEALNDDVEWILGDWGRKEAMNQSFALSRKIARKMSKLGFTPFRGIKQANFVILRNLQKPSILVEVAFLTNRKDASLIKKSSVKRQIARAIATGIVEYLFENPPEGCDREPVMLLTHIVGRGDTLGRIARKYGTTIREICNMNGIKRSSTIRPGQKLKVMRKIERLTGS